MKPRKAQLLYILGCTGFLLLHFWFGLNYSLATPAWEGYDEPAHFAYAVQLAETGTLPQETDPIPNPERIQPPLYYMGLAVSLRLSNTHLPNFTYPDRNPYFYYGTSGLNYALHRLTLSATEQQQETALRFTRFLSLIASLFAVVFVARAARILWPGRTGLQLALTGLFALWPQLLFNSSVVTNDGMAAVFGALLTWQCLAFRPRQSSLWLLLASLITLVIGGMIKLNILLLAGPLLFAIFRTRSRRLILLTLALMVAGLAAVLFILASLPGVLIPLFRTGYDGEGFFVSLFRRLSNPDTLPFIGQALKYALDSSFGLFGWGNVPLPDTLNSLWMVGVALGGAGLLVVIGQQIRAVVTRGTRQHPPVALLVSIVLFSLIGAVALAVFYVSIHLVPGRYLLPALAAFLFLMGLGWLTLRLRPLIWGSLAGLILLGFLIPGQVIGRAYSIPPETSGDAIPHQADTLILPGIRFLGWDIPEQLVYPGDEFRFDVFWRAETNIPTSNILRIEVIAADGQGYALLETLPGNAMYLTSDWKVGQLFRDTYRIRVRKDYPAPMIGRLRLTMEPPDGAWGHVEFGSIPIRARTTPPMPIPAEKSAQFREVLRLRDLRMTLPDPKTLRGRYVWEATRQMPDGTIFIHLDSATAENVPPLAQKDGPPLNGGWRTGYLLPGEAFEDQFELALPTELAAGRYPIRIGLYDAHSADFQRWTVQLGERRDDALLIGWLNVAADGQRTLTINYP